MTEPQARRWPAEWERHEATWIGWPHHRPDWPDKFEPIPWVYAEIVRALHTSEPVHILCNGEETRAAAEAALRAHDVDLARCTLHLVPTDRVWLRDSGPTGVYGPKGFEWIAWKFNAWAKYENYGSDEQVARAIAQLSERPLTEAEFSDGRRVVLEGGGIEGNGAGTMLVTEEWLLSDVQVRNPGVTRTEYEAIFAQYLGIDRTLWLGEGCVGDDTHGHIDDVARFVDTNTVVLTWEDDPADENHRRMRDNLQRLQHAARAFPGGLRIIKLPFPRPVIMQGEQLPASYANFYIANDVVIVPTFNDRSDRIALNQLAELFPARAIIGIHAVGSGVGARHAALLDPAATRKSRLTN